MLEKEEAVHRVFAWKRACAVSGRVMHAWHAHAAVAARTALVGREPYMTQKQDFRWATLWLRSFHEPAPRAKPQTPKTLDLVFAVEGHVGRARPRAKNDGLPAPRKV